MPDTTPLAPTDAELMQVIREAAFDSTIRRNGSTSLRIARAVLEKWGAPAPASSETVDPQEHLFELWWAEYMPEATQAQAWGAWIASLQAQPVAALAGMPEPAGIITVMSYKTFLDISVSEWRDEYADGEYPIFTAPQVQALLAQRVVECESHAQTPQVSSGPALAPLTAEQFVTCIKLAGFKTWDSRMWQLKRQIEAAHGITAAKKGGQHAD